MELKPSRNLALVVLMICLVNVTGACTEAFTTQTTEWVRHDSWSSNVHFADWPDVNNRSIGVGFLRPEEREIHPYERRSTYQFEIGASEPFTTDLILSTGKERAVLVSLFVDYQQTSFSLDGIEGLLHYFVINPDEELEIPLSVNITGEGWHDLFVVVFFEPEKHPTDLEMRLPGSSLHLSGRRTVVCVVDCIHQPSLPRPITGEDKQVNRLLVNALPLLPGEESPQQRLLLSTSVKSNTTLDIELWARNSDHVSRDYLVLPMLDFMQVPFTQNDDGLLHLTLPPGHELYLPGQIAIPTIEGTHEFLFIFIFNPYQPLDEVADPFVQSEMRSAIVVEQ